jgi:hypothetical protein
LSHRFQLEGRFYTAAARLPSRFPNHFISLPLSSLS